MRSWIAAILTLWTTMAAAQVPAAQGEPQPPAPDAEVDDAASAPGAAEAPAAGTESPAGDAQEAADDEVAPAPAPDAAPAPAPGYAEPPQTPADQPAVVQLVPPPPGGYVYEPPPPPKPRHAAPKYSFWVGARLGWFEPFGNLWADELTPGFFQLNSFKDYATSGPMLELDIGARLSRYYNVFLLWERVQLRDGNFSGDLNGGQSGGDSDFVAIGLRATSDPNRVGLMTELAFGARRLRVTWEDGSELQFSDAPLETRLGLGADIRINEHFALSPLLTLGVGAFATIERVNSDGTVAQEPTFDARTAHYWFTLQLGAHVDLFGSK